MNEWAEGKVSLDAVFMPFMPPLTIDQACSLHFPLRVAFKSSQLAESDQSRLMQDVETLLSTAKGPGLYSFTLTTEEESIDHVNRRPANDSTALTVILDRDENASSPQSALRTWASILEIHHNAQLPADTPQLARFVAQEIRKVFDHEQASMSYLLSDGPFSGDSGASFITPAGKAALERRTTRAFGYASTYHLTFSLFSSSASPSSWEIEEALNEYITPLAGPFSVVSNFTIDTQVQLFASFSPSIAGPKYDEASKKWKLLQSDLSGFVNAAEWPLSPSIGAGPTINFVLYVPSPGQSPLIIAETGGNSWIIPQWGGVQIYNPSRKEGDKLTLEDLRPVMVTFADQLTSLLGLPQSPPSLALRISSLTRERAASLIVSASSTLGALSRLTLKLTSIEIPESVAKSVDETLLRLDAACQNLGQGNFEKALENARVAEAEAEKAFFEPSMVGQVYFPDEHKVAVYVPLLGPMAVPLVLAALKEIKRLSTWLRQGKLKAA